MIVGKSEKEKLPRHAHSALANAVKASPDHFPQLNHSLGVSYLNARCILNTNCIVVSFLPQVMHYLLEVIPLVRQYLITVC